MKKKNQLIKTSDSLNQFFKQLNLNFLFNSKYIYIYNFINWNFKNLNFFFFFYNSLPFNYIIYNLLNKNLIILNFLNFLIFLNLKNLYANKIKFLIFLLNKKWIFLSNFKPVTPSKRWLKISKNLKFKFFYYSNNNLWKNKKNYNNLVNFHKKKNLYSFNLFNNLNLFKNSYILTSIKKKISNYYIGVFKTISGIVFLHKISNGTFLGDILKTSIFPLKLIKTNTLNIFTTLKNLNIYSIFSNLFINKKNIISSSSGTYCQLLELKNNFNLVVIKIPSNRKIIVSNEIFCLTGRNSNINKKYEIFSKASYKINLGKKPSVRGVAKNPVDHPHGGRTKTVQPEVSPWGWVTKYSH